MKTDIRLEIEKNREEYFKKIKEEYFKNKVYPDQLRAKPQPSPDKKEAVKKQLRVKAAKSSKEKASKTSSPPANTGKKATLNIQLVKNQMVKRFRRFLNYLERIMFEDIDGTAPTEEREETKSGEKEPLHIPGFFRKAVLYLWVMLELDIPEFVMNTGRGAREKIGKGKTLIINKIRKTLRILPVHSSLLTLKKKTAKILPFLPAFIPLLL